MTAGDSREDPEGIALVEGILERVGYAEGQQQPASPIADVDFTGVVDALAAFGVKLERWQVAFLEDSMPLRRMAGAFSMAGLAPELPPAGQRARALLAKQHRGKGPPSSSGWRGRERNIKYRSQ